MNKIFSLVGVKRTICKGKLNIVEKKANSGSRLAFGESVVEFGETNRENLRWPAQIREFVEISIICPNFHVYNWKSWQTNNEFTAVPPIPRPQNCSVVAWHEAVHSYPAINHVIDCYMVRIIVGRKKSSLDSTLQIIKLIMATVLSSSSSATKTSSAASLLRLYGVPLSQPFRSVAWTLLLHRVSFTIQLTVPGAKTSIGSRNENYLKLTNGRSNVIPILQVEEDGRDGTFTIMESPAILTYICERYGSGAARYSSTDQAHADNWLLPPRASKEKTMVDSYMHWHHTNNTRR